MDTGILKSIIIEKQIEIPEHKIVSRDIEFDINANYVLVGLRRAGKSYLLFQDAQKMIERENISADNLLYINFEDERLAYVRSEELGLILNAYQELYPGLKPLIYLDEIQNIEGWEKFARRLADSGYRVMITGSNAKMLGREIYSTLGGRYIPREVFPFSFEEYLKYTGTSIGNNWEYNPELRARVSRYFDNYFTGGGIAESFKFIDRREYLNSLYQKILLGDIIERNRIRNTRVFRLLARKLADSVMQPTSLSRLQHIIKSTGDDISLPGLKDFLEYLEESYLFFYIPNLASSTVDRATIQKRYMADNGLLNLFLYKGETKLLENIVATELNRRYRNTAEETLLYYYNRNIEVDFCIPSSKMAIQVSYSISEDSTYMREAGSLAKFIKANKGYSGYIITRDEEKEIIEDGVHITVVPVWKWLLAR